MDVKKTKISRVREAMHAGDWDAAIKMAAKFPRLGEQRNAILSASGALNNPRFYTQLGRDINAVIYAGRQALIDKYGQP